MMVHMEKSWLRILLDKISSFLSLSSLDNLYSNPAYKYYTRGEEIGKLLKPVLENLVGSDAAPSELLENGFEELAQYVDELRELFEIWQPLSSRIFCVLRIELVALKLRESSMEVFQLLKHCEQHLPTDLSSPSFEDCLEKIKLVGREEMSYTIDQALIDQREGVGPTPEVLVKIAEGFGLRSNQEILIEGVALANMKENAELAENNSEVEFLDRLISLITQMHDYLLSIRQSELSCPVSVPPDFLCPLSLQLMTDPVILASGQTYERVFIQHWIDMGLLVCPKTRKALSPAPLTSNFIVKAFISNWCESNNVSPPNPLELIQSNQPFSLLVASDANDSNSSGPMLQDESLECDESKSERASTSHLQSSSETSLPVMFRNGSANSSVYNAGDKNISPRGRTESLDATKCENLPQVFSRSTSAPDIVSDVVSKTEISSAADAPITKKERSKQLHWLPSQRRHPEIIPATIRETGTSSSIETEAEKLVANLTSSSLDILREATARIRMLSRTSTDNRIVLARAGAISLLVNLLQSPDAKIQADAVTALLNLSINDNNKSVITESGAIELLIHVLKTGSQEAKENSAATLFSLSVLRENKPKIGEAGAIEPLVDLLSNGSLRGKKDAVTALFNLSIHQENKTLIIEAGAVKHLVDLMNPIAGMVEKAVAVLANLATIKEGKIAIGEEGGIPVLVEVVELGSGRGKENATAALLHLCMHSPRFCNAVIREGAIPPLVSLTKSGTARAREKATNLLKYFRSQRQGNHGRG